MKKIYGVIGLMEWIAVIAAGAATLKIRFSGGFPTANGITPAEFSTDNPVVQHAIENSDYFKNGKIVLLREFESVNRVAYKPQRNKRVVQDDEGAKNTGQSTEKVTVESETGVVQEREVIAVGSLADAAAVLKERFGIPTAKIKSKEAAKAAGIANGIEFEWV